MSTALWVKISPKIALRPGQGLAVQQVDALHLVGRLQAAGGQDRRRQVDADGRASSRRAAASIRPGQRSMIGVRMPPS